MQLFPSGEMLLKRFSAGKIRAGLSGHLSGKGAQRHRHGGRLRAGQPGEAGVRHHQQRLCKRKLRGARGRLFAQAHLAQGAGGTAGQDACRKEIKPRSRCRTGRRCPRAPFLYHLRGTLCHPDAARRQSLRVRTTQNAMAELLLACPGLWPATRAHWLI